MDKVAFFWTGWDPIFRIIVVGTLTYIGIVLILRISAKRTLANMNAFDFIITIAMGSAFGRILTASEVSVSESIVTFLLLASLQFTFSYFDGKSKIFRWLITSQPTLLYYNGEFIEKNMSKEKVLQENIFSALRKQQFGSFKNVEAIILEVNGSISIIKKNLPEEDSTYKELLKS